MNKNPILEQLKREALYAQRSLSTELLHQTYGKAKMARRLEALTESERGGTKHEREKKSLDTVDHGNHFTAVHVLYS